jgi:hypothetical protein
VSEVRVADTASNADFVIPLQTSILTNQYMEFLWSHAGESFCVHFGVQSAQPLSCIHRDVGYWTDTTFADFLLATLYSSPDRLRQAKEKLAKET